MLFKKNPRAIMIISRKGFVLGIKLLNFDVWDTLIIDDSDEGEEKDWPSNKNRAKRFNFEAYNKDYHSFGGQLIQQSIVEMEEQYQISWKEKYETPGVRWRLNQVEKLLGRQIKKPVMIDEKIKLNLIQKLEDMELEFPIMPVPGANEFLATFKK